MCLHFYPLVPQCCIALIKKRCPLSCIVPISTLLPAASAGLGGQCHHVSSAGNRWGSERGAGALHAVSPCRARHPLWLTLPSDSLLNISPTTFLPVGPSYLCPVMMSSERPARQCWDTRIFIMFVKILILCRFLSTILFPVLFKTEVGNLWLYKYCAVFFFNTQ